MGIFLDLIVLGIIVIFAVISAKRGFVRTLIELVGFFLAIVIANSISPAISNGVYDKLVEPAIVKSVEELNIDETPVGNIIEIPDDVLPKFVTNLTGEGFSLKAFTDKINENISNGTKEAVITASQEVAKPIIVNILNLIFTIIIALILIILVDIIAAFINKLFSFSIIGKVNKILGAVLGMLKGGIISTVVASAISFLATVLPNGFLSVTADTIANTILFKLLIFSNLL